MMAAQVTRQMKDSMTIEVTLSLEGSMLEVEEAIQDALNEAGLLPPRRSSSSSIPMGARFNGVPSV